MGSLEVPLPLSADQAHAGIPSRDQLNYYGTVQSPSILCARKAPTKYSTWRVALGVAGFHHAYAIFFACFRGIPTFLCILGEKLFL